MDKTTYISSDSEKYIETAIGDEKQVDFYPRLKIKKWDNEVNLSVGLTETDGVKTELGDRVVYETDKLEAHFYPIEDEWGGYEFSIILKEKPDTNVIPLSVTTKGLDFHYQPDLPEEEKLKYDELREGFLKAGGDLANFPDPRPENVIGSYAAYHKSKMDNQYGAGKAFHIYRSWAEDANGVRVWCEFDPDWDYENDQPLNITIPQDYLDNAVYPVLVDPTFGYTTAGASNTTFSNATHGTDNSSAVECAEGISIAIYRSVTDAAGGPARWKTALYEADTGALLGNTTEQTRDGGSLAAGWETVAFISKTNFRSGTKWLMAWHLQNSFCFMNLYYDTLASAQTFKALTYVTGSGSWPDPLSGLSDGNNRFSIYVNYIEGPRSPAIFHSGTATY